MGYSTTHMSSLPMSDIPFRSLSTRLWYRTSSSPPVSIKLTLMSSNIVRVHPVHPPPSQSDALRCQSRRPPSSSCYFVENPRLTTMCQRRRQREILCTLLRSSSSPRGDVFYSNGERNTCISDWGLVPLQQCMPLSCQLTRSTLRRVRERGRCRLLGGSVSGFSSSRLVSRYCTSPSSSLILLEAYRSPRGLNRLSRVVYSSLVPFSSIT